MRFYLDNEHRLQNAINFLSRVEVGKGLVCEIKPEKRSLDQNAKWHVWLDQMALHSKVTPHEMKIAVKRMVFGMKEVINPLTGEISYRDYQSSDLDKEMFSMLMTQTQLLALEYCDGMVLE